MTTTATPLMHTRLVDELRERLELRGIIRSDRSIDQAIQGALESYWDEAGHRCEAETLRLYEQTWDDLLHGAFGIYDRLEIDSEDLLYDRHAGELLTV